MLPSPSLSSEDKGPRAWIDLARADDDRDAIHQAVACLAQGGVVGLASETVYGVVASALHPRGVTKVRELRGIESARPLTLLLRGPREVADWVPGISRLGQRLAGRLWPGPVTLVFPNGIEGGLSDRLPAEVKPLIFPRGEVALRSPSHPVLRDILRLLSIPLVIGMYREADQTPAFTAEAFRNLPDLDMVLDAGPTQFRNCATVVRVDSDRWSVEREGVVDTPTVRRMSGLILLFVCTGNTCRSPMAEAICKVLLARRLACEPDELEEHGFVVLSAGVAAINGVAAAGHAIEIVREMGGSLDEHRSRKVTLNLVRQADRVFAMTGDHLESLLDAVPEVEARSCLLDPEGGDLADPIGSDYEMYRYTAETIERFLKRRFDELGI